MGTCRLYNPFLLPDIDTGGSVHGVAVVGVVVSAVAVVLMISMF